jgi:putative membrane protein
MRSIKWVLTTLVVGCAVVLGALFSLQNAEPVALDLLLIQLSPRAMSIWLLLALGVGGLLGLMVSMAIILRFKTRLGKAERDRKRLQTEVDRLRRVGLSTSD